MRGSFSESGPWMQFMMLIFLVLGGAVFFSVLGLMSATLFFPVEVSDIPDLMRAPYNELSIEVLKYLQGFTTLGVFLVPGLFGAYLFSPTPGAFLGIESFPRRSGLVVVLLILLALSGTTISDAFYRLSKSIDWPQSLAFLKEIIESTEELMGEQIEAFLRMDSFGDFIEVFLIMAILPAVCEETLFRGTLQPVLNKALRNRHLGIWLTAFFFALLHQQFYTFLSILALGAVLGYLKEWSGSLWVPVILHLVNNGTIVIISYFGDMSYSELNDLTGTWQIQYALPGMLLFAVLLFLLYRLTREKEQRVHNEE